MGKVILFSLLLFGCTTSSDSFVGSAHNPITLTHNQIVMGILILAIAGIVEPRAPWVVLMLVAFFVYIQAILLVW